MIPHQNSAYIYFSRIRAKCETRQYFIDLVNQVIFKDKKTMEKETSNVERVFSSLFLIWL